MDYVKQAAMDNLKQNEKEIRNLDSGGNWSDSRPKKKHSVWFLLIALGLIAAVITISKFC